jgi:hypothetical protein
LFPRITNNAAALECARTIAWLETAARGGLLDHPVTPSQEPGSADEALIGLEPIKTARIGG